MDQAGNALAGNASINWVTDLTAPTVTMTAITPNPRNTSVGVLTFDFSKAVTGFDRSDLTLLRNGQVVSLSALTLTTVSATRYTINLATVTATPGAYTLILNAPASGIADAAGNRLATGLQTAWTMDNQAPTATLTGDLASPRNSRVGVVTARLQRSCDRC